MNKCLKWHEKSKQTPDIVKLQSNLATPNLILLPGFQSGSKSLLPLKKVNF